MSGAVARALVLAVAVPVVAWLAVLERDTRLQARGTAVAQRLEEPGNAARAERSFRDARLFNPDTAPDLSRAFLYRATDRQAAAVALVEDVLRREPDNLTAWGVLATFARGQDPEAVARALAARRRLDPLSAGRR